MSHFNACFRLAKQLVTDHEVVFAGHTSFSEYIKTQGFIFYPLTTVPFGMGFEQWIAAQTNFTSKYFVSLNYRLSDKLYFQREKELNQLLIDLDPNCILLDSYQATDFIVMYPELLRRNIRFALLQTMLPTTFKENIPPINSLALPSDSKAIQEAIRNNAKKNFKKKIKEKLLYLGMDDGAIIKRRLKKNKVSPKYISNNTALRGVSLTHIPEFILAPKEFDFPGASSSSQQYVGFNPELNRVEVSDMEYFKVDQQIRQKLDKNQSILIYCSFGSIQAGDTSAVTIFLEKLINAVSDSNCVLVVSINAIQHERAFSKIPGNVYILKAAPQLEILSRADIFITHGGLNSIKESIYMGVPMLVYPLHDITDTSGNSSRVVYHGLGSRGDLLKDTIEDIDNKIIDLINNSIYRTNILTLREQDETYHHLFRKLFDELKPLR